MLVSNSVLPVFRRPLFASPPFYGGSEVHRRAPGPEGPSAKSACGPDSLCPFGLCTDHARLTCAPGRSDIFHKKNRKVQIVQAVEHPAELGLVPQVSGKDRYGRLVIHARRVDAHTPQPVGPCLIQAAADLYPVIARLFEFDFPFDRFTFHMAIAIPADLAVLLPDQLVSSDLRMAGCPARPPKGGENGGF